MSYRNRERVVGAAKVLEGVVADYASKKRDGGDLSETAYTDLDEHLQGTWTKGAGAQGSKGFLFFCAKSSPKRLKSDHKQTPSIDSSAERQLWDCAGEHYTDCAIKVILVAGSTAPVKLNESTATVLADQVNVVMNKIPHQMLPLFEDGTIPIYHVIQLGLGWAVAVCMPNVDELHTVIECLNNTYPEKRLHYASQILQISLGLQKCNVYNLDAKMGNFGVQGDKVVLLDYESILDANWSGATMQPLTVTIRFWREHLNDNDWLPDDVFERGASAYPKTMAALSAMAAVNTCISVLQPMGCHAEYERRVGLDGQFLKDPKGWKAEPGRKYTEYMKRATEYVHDELKQIIGLPTSTPDSIAYLTKSWAVDFCDAFHRLVACCDPGKFCENKNTSKPLLASFVDRCTFK